MVPFIRRVIAAGLSAFGSFAAAQPAVVTVPAEPTCRTCTLELTRVVTLGRATDSVLLGELVGVVAVNSRGEYFAPCHRTTTA